MKKIVKRTAIVVTLLALAVLFASPWLVHEAQSDEYRACAAHCPGKCIQSPASGHWTCCPHCWWR